MTSAQRGVRFCGWLIILWLSILFTAATAEGQARLGVPSYQDPGSPQWTDWAAPPVIASMTATSCRLV